MSGEASHGWTVFSAKPQAAIPSLPCLNSELRQTRSTGFQPVLLMPEHGLEARATGIFNALSFQILITLV